MKRFLTILLFITLFGSVDVFAEDLSPVDFEIQIGSYVAVISGEAKSIEAPILSDGSTLVPLGSIAEAFDAKCSENEITYNDIKITFTPGSKVAMVDDLAAVMPTAPVKVNDSLMVPIRFICDKFNALIEYEDETGIIRVTKSADFSQIFDKPTSGCWSNEDYGWMIKLPVSYSLSTNTYDGSLTRFLSNDNNAAFTMYTEKNIYQNIQQVRAKVLIQNSGISLREESILKIDGKYDAFYAEYEDFALIVAIKDDYVFDFEFIALSEDVFKANVIDAREGLKSLTFTIDKGKNPENVSILNEGGYNVYTDKDFGFSVNLMESWNEPEHIGSNTSVWTSNSYNLLNKLYSDEFYHGEMNLKIFSKQEGDTPETLRDMKIKSINESYNSEYLYDLKTSEATSEDFIGTHIEYTILYNGRKQYSKVRYFCTDEYIYELNYYILFSEGTDEKLLDIEYTDKMFDSIKIKSANSDLLGTVINVNTLVSNDITQIYENERGNFRTEIPAIWNTYTDATSIISTNTRKTMNTELYVTNQFDKLDDAKDLFYGKQIELLKSSNAYISSQCVKTSFKGKTAYRMDFKHYNDEFDIVKTRAYLFIHKGEAYYFSTTILDIYSSDKNMETLNKIEQSFKLLN